METCRYACLSGEHSLSRRGFLGGMAAGVASLAGLATPALGKQLEKDQKHVLMIYLSGGVSQLETWDPKPGTPTGGPFRAISTSVPGIQICELLPHTARQMHHLALVRGLNTAENEHGRGSYIMHTGRRQEPAMKYPHLGSVMSKVLGAEHTGLPGYVHISPGGGGGFNKQDAAFLGPRYASVTLGNGKPPENLLRPQGMTDQAEHDRNDLQDRVNQRFARSRRTAETEAYTHSFEQAKQMMARKHLFEVEREPTRIQERYGKHDFGRHCLLARRLIESGATFVKVSHSNYDTHYENFEYHIEQLGEFDQTFATLLDDLHQRGLLKHTLVTVVSEFGRTPTINRNYGRDHWSKAWSIALAGAGIKGGTAVGKTNATGTAVTDREVNGGHVFHTYFRALGLSSTRNFYIDERPIPMADPKAAPITEVLA